MPRSLMACIYNERTREPADEASTEMEVDHPDDVMKTRSGLSIKKYSTFGGKELSSSSSKYRTSSSSQLSGDQRCLNQILRDQPKKHQVIRQNVGISIVTRYGMFLNGVEIDCKDLNLTNEASAFFVKKQHICDSITAMDCDRTAESASRTEGVSPTPLQSSCRVKSLSTSALSGSEPASVLRQTLLGRSASVPLDVPEDLSTCKIEPTTRSFGKPSADKHMRLLFERQSPLDVESESAESLASKLRSFCSVPQEAVTEDVGLYKCSLCHQVYGGMKAFAQHVNSHIKLKNKCTECGRVFSRSWLLKGHMRIHTGEKPFQCSACGKRFADKSNMRSHLLTHTATKRTHRCDKCGKTFAQRRYLRKHLLEVCNYNRVHARQQLIIQQNSTTVAVKVESRTRVV